MQLMLQPAWTSKDGWTLIWAPTKWHGSVNRWSAEGTGVCIFPLHPNISPSPRRCNRRALQIADCDKGARKDD